MPLFGPKAGHLRNRRKREKFVERLRSGNPAHIEVIRELISILPRERSYYEKWPVHKQTLTVKTTPHKDIAVGSAAVKGRKIHWIRITDKNGKEHFIGPLNERGELLQHNTHAQTPQK